jgi:hypothetical protein
VKFSYSPHVTAARDQQVHGEMSRLFAHATKDMTDDAREMVKNRRVMRQQGRRQAFSRTAASGGSGAGSGFSDIQFATGRPRDPLFYWRQNNLPYDFSQNEELAKVRAFCRLLYQTDPIIGACIDIFSKYPTLGWSLGCKDNKLVEFYTEQFFDQDHLDYDEFLVDIGREYFIAGEAWPFATFDEDLGIWSDEELLNPDDIKVERSPFLKDPRYFIRLPWTIRQILQTRQPAWEYNKLIREYPELSAYTSENSFMPVSNVLLKQLKFKGDTFNVRGLPLLTRAMRACLQQEMLNTAMDAIADRLYTPLILCKLGASASDLGTSVPWIPTDDDLENFELALDAALAADFRALIYNFGVEMAPVLGRENMPDLTPDFERIEDRMLMTFGLSRTLLVGADGGQTYAADALNRDLVTMLMTRYQRFLARHFRDRALIVAEAQEHYDYEERNGKRYVIMEEVLETDEESGEKRIVEQPRLLVPDLRMRTLNFKDEDTTRQFVEALRASGVPISQRTRTRDLGIDLDEEIERSADENVDLIVQQQRVRKRAYSALRDEGLPIAPDLQQDFMPKAQIEGVPPTLAAEQIMQPRIGLEPIPLPDLAPTPEDFAAGEDTTEGQDEAMAEEEGAPPGEDGDEGARPEESDEQRGDMPKKEGRKMTTTAQLFKRAARVRDATAIAGVDSSINRLELANQIIAEGSSHTWEMEPHFDRVIIERLGSEQPEEKITEWHSGPTPDCYNAPRHLGIRRRLPVDDERVNGEMYPEFARSS